MDFMLASEICHLQSGLTEYLSVLDLNHLLHHPTILLKLSSLNPISIHSLKNQTEPRNVTLEGKQQQYKRKKYLKKTTQKGLEKKQKKVSNLTINTNNKTIFDIKGFLGKIQNTFVSASGIVLKIILVIKITCQQ